MADGDLTDRGKVLAMARHFAAHRAFYRAMLTGPCSYSLNKALLQRVLKLGPPITRDLVIRRDLRVPMPDGAQLLADLWEPRSGGESWPICLMRSPYGRRGLVGAAAGRARLPRAC